MKNKVPNQDVLSFQDALDKLNIRDFEERIMKSNSHGELFHCMDYIQIAQALGKNTEWFRSFFLAVVKWAEETWERPESVFQHMPRILAEASMNDGEGG